MNKKQRRRANVLAEHWLRFHGRMVIDGFMTRQKRRRFGMPSRAER